MTNTAEPRSTVAQLGSTGTDLATFLLARIAERESVAQDMQDQARLGRPFFNLPAGVGGTGIRDLIDPARILAECEAKRQIVALHEANPDVDQDCRFFCDHCDHPAPCPDLCILASPYVDHPDYREEWKP